MEPSVSGTARLGRRGGPHPSETPTAGPAREPEDREVRAGHDQTGPGERPSEGVEAETPLHLPLVHDGVGVAVRDAVLVGEPVGALFTAQEGRTGFHTSEPLSKVTTRDAGYARDQIFVRLQGASQRQLAPPGVVKPLAVSLP